MLHHLPHGVYAALAVIYRVMGTPLAFVAIHQVIGIRLAVLNAHALTQQICPLEEEGTVIPHMCIRYLSRLVEVNAIYIAYIAQYGWIVVCPLAHRHTSSAPAIRAVVTIHWMNRSTASRRCSCLPPAKRCLLASSLCLLHQRAVSASNVNPSTKADLRSMFARNEKRSSPMNGVASAVLCHATAAMLITAAVGQSAHVSRSKVISNTIPYMLSYVRVGNTPHTGFSLLLSYFSTNGSSTARMPSSSQGRQLSSVNRLMTVAALIPLSCIKEMNILRSPLVCPRLS